MGMAGATFHKTRNLGFDNDCLSGGVKRMIGHTAGVLSFNESSLMIKNLAGLHVGSKQVERAGEALGEEIVNTEKSEVVEGRLPAATPCISAWTVQDVRCERKRPKGVREAAGWIGENPGSEIGRCLQCRQSRQQRQTCPGSRARSPITLP